MSRQHRVEQSKVRRCDAREAGRRIIGTAPIVVQLSPGQQVVLIESASGWALVARDGKKLGYIEEKVLARLQ